MYCQTRLLGLFLLAMLATTAHGIPTHATIGRQSLSGQAEIHRDVRQGVRSPGPDTSVVRVTGVRPAGHTRPTEMSDHWSFRPLAEPHR